MELYPLERPFDRGLLDVGDGQHIAWQVFGAPKGKPAVVLHGGPGQGASAQMARGFDPARYRVVLFDQRGCGASIPHASDPTTSLEPNHTWNLVADMEALRRNLRIDAWLVCGASWGAALALAYASRHPERITELVLSASSTFRAHEVEWLYVGASRFFPEAWSRFRGHVHAPPTTTATQLMEAYLQRLEDTRAEVREAAADAFCAWEDAVLSLEEAPPKSCELPRREKQALTRICAHYALHAGFMSNEVVAQATRNLASTPGVILHGRRDLSCPLETAWELSQAWPNATFVPLDDAGHGRSNSKRAALLEALRRYADNREA